MSCAFEIGASMPKCLPQKVYVSYLDTSAVTCRILLRSRAVLRLQGRLPEA
jgi:hypothetical protein